MITIDDLLQELEQEAHTTRRVLERIPEDQLAWKPHVKSRTLGELALHIAVVPGAIAEIATLPGFDVNTPVPQPVPASVAEVLAALDESIAKAKASLGGMDEATLQSPWRMMDGDRVIFETPRVAFLRSVMLNHWYHHRGQLTVYLRQTGASVPAVYGSSADENPFAAGSS
jgi:uncharacterized damage-inducible protein DinB